MEDYTYSLPEEVLNQVDGGCLFFPHCSDNYIEALFLFRYHITDFWFVDPDYFTGGWSAARTYRSFPRRHTRFKLQSKKVEGSEPERYRWNMNPGDPADQYISVEPCALTEVYLDHEEGRTVTIRRIRAHPPEVFQTLPRLSVFYYCFNPYKNNVKFEEAEEWLVPGATSGGQPVGWFDRVLDKLADKALIVTDGLHLSIREGPYSELRRTFGQTLLSRGRGMSEAQAFRDEKGRDFRCVGYSYPGDMGPVLIWQVTRPPSIL